MAEPVKPIVVLDTNLYVSYLITPSGPTARLVEIGLAGEVFMIATSPGLMEELRRVVAYPHLISKYGIDPKAVVALFTLLHRKAHVTAGAYTVSKLDDPGDNMVLACGLESAAQYIVTGDPHLLNLKEFRGDPHPLRRRRRCYSLWAAAGHLRQGGLPRPAQSSHLAPSNPHRAGRPVRPSPHSMGLFSGLPSFDCRNVVRTACELPLALVASWVMRE